MTTTLTRQVQCTRQYNGMRCSGQVYYDPGTEELHCRLCNREYTIERGQAFLVGGGQGILDLRGWGHRSKR